MSPAVRAWAREHSVGVILAAAIVYAAGIVGAFMFAAEAVQREADERVAAVEAQDEENAIDLLRASCATRNEFRGALDQIFVRLDRLTDAVELRELFADLLVPEDCDAIGPDPEGEP